MVKSIRIAIAPNRRILQNYLDRLKQKAEKPEHACLKKSDGTFYRLTSEQSGKVNTLIKKECCNHDSGNCVMLEYGEGCKCPQIASLHICCTWFREAVLPLDKVLESSIFGNKDMKKRCAMCGKLFVPTNNRAKFCTKCIPKANRQRLQNHRAKNRTQNKNI